MTCCENKGVIKVSYRDGTPTMYGLCLCQAGMALRSDMNAGKHTSYPLWNVWAAQHQVEHDQIAFIEELLDPDEILAMFPTYRPEGRAAVDDDAAIVAAARPGKVRL